ncbi:uncharacterized protein LOC108033340 isoform X2 [Drosophila biarmipes]|uniref:uncharacterized protein LOC108033340 isoform X2 n=1 Tax=Drosophila biarmipes TaxID=125945 RepID=UPI0007E806D4|nr:uncharacterized protein LOC108033340 isoform X2 [Drosophila biarmipes]
MWSHQYKVRPQMHLPLVHEQIALQCARNIVRVASAMPQPQPRCPSGYMAVLVELRRVDEPTVHRYQVNVPTTGWPTGESQGPEEQESVQQLVLPGTLETMGLKVPGPERPPCPMHGRAIMDAGNATEVWSPDSHSGPPPLVMTQCSMHLVNDQNPKEVATFSEPAVAGEPPEALRAHFMASLYQQHPSPLSYSDIWVHGGTPGQGPSCPREISSQPRSPQLCLGESNEYVATSEARRINGLKEAPKRTPGSGNGNGNEPRMMAELCLDSNGEYVPNEQLQRLSNGHRSHAIPKEMRTEPNFYGQHQSQHAESPPKGPNGYKGEFCGYSYIGKEPGKPKNGYKDGFSERGKVLAQVQAQEPSPVMGRVAMIEPRIRQEAPVGLQDNLSLPSLPVTVPSAPPQAYPRELQALFRWNYCALCHTVMRSQRNALDHYASRAHDRRISSWLVRHCPTGHAGQAVGAVGVSDETLQYLRALRPADFYCELCDLKLTSMMHAQQHFFGRRHRMVARQMTKPNGEGFYDPEGRWVRTDAKFLMCELCDVSITSESQMAMHMAGARHRRRVHSVYAARCADGMALGMDINVGGGVGLAPFNGGQMYGMNANASLAPLRPMGLQILPAPQPRPIGDPVAAYYCQACNITLNHVKSLKQHEQGRMHRRNVHRLPGQPVFYE